MNNQNIISNKFDLIQAICVSHTVLSVKNFNHLQKGDRYQVNAQKQPLESSMLNYQCLTGLIVTTRSYYRVQGPRSLIAKLSQIKRSYT
jgi:hypothetical protein